MATLLEKCNNIKNDKELNLKPENLKAGIICLGVTGELEPGIDTSDATAVADDIAAGKIAYVNGEKIEGSALTFEKNECYTHTGQMGVQNNSEKTAIEVTTMLFDNPAMLFKQYSRIDSTVNYSTLKTLGEITSDKIVEGQTIFGVTGTAITGVDTSDANAMPENLMEGYSAYVNGERINGTLQTSSVDGALMMTGIQMSDYDATISYEVPETKIIQAGDGFWPTISFSEIAMQQNVMPEQIVEGYRILGVDGTAKLGYDTSDADAMAENIEPGYCAYTRDGLVWGSMNVAEGMTFDSAYDKEKPEYQIFYDEAANNVEQIYKNDNKVLLVEGTEMNIRVSGADIAEVAGITSDKIVEGNTILGIPGSATAGASGPFIYRYDSENTSIAILANYHQGHLDYYDTAFFDAVLSGAKDLRYGKWLQNNRTYLSVDTSEYVLLDTFYSLLEKAQAVGMNNENIVDDIFYLNGWYFNLSSGSYYESETGEILPGAMDFTDYHGGYRVAFVRTDNGIFVTDVQSLSDFTKAVDVTVKMAESNGLLSSITFNYETGVTGAECVVNNETMTQIEAWFPDNTEYTRTFLFTRDSYEFDNAEEFSAYNGNPIHYQYLSDVDAHKYVWLSNEAEGIYLSMLSKNEQTITQVGDIIERVSYTINN